MALRPVDRNLAPMALLFRAGESVVGAVGIATSFAVLHVSLAVRDATAFDADQLGALVSMFASGASTEIAAIFFSLGVDDLFLRVPEINVHSQSHVRVGHLCFSVLRGALVRTADRVGFSALVVYLGSLPILIAELSTGLWLLIKGIKTQSV